MVGPLAPLSLQVAFKPAAAEAVASLKAGQVVEAVVARTTADGLTTLKVGDLVLAARLAQAPAPGTILRLEVRAAGPVPQLVQLPALPTRPAPSPPSAPVPAARAPLAAAIVSPKPPPPVAGNGVATPIQAVAPLPAAETVAAGSPPVGTMQHAAGVEAAPRSTESATGGGPPAGRTAIPQPTATPSDAAAPQERAAPGAAQANAPSVDAAPRPAAGNTARPESNQAVVRSGVPPASTREDVARVPSAATPRGTGPASEPTPGEAVTRSSPIPPPRVDAVAMQSRSVPPVAEPGAQRIPASQPVLPQVGPTLAVAKAAPSPSPTPASAPMPAGNGVPAPPANAPLATARAAAPVGNAGNSSAVVAARVAEVGGGQPVASPPPGAAAPAAQMRGAPPAMATVTSGPATTAGWAAPLSPSPGPPGPSAAAPATTAQSGPVTLVQGTPEAETVVPPPAVLARGAESASPRPASQESIAGSGRPSTSAPVPPAAAQPQPVPGEIAQALARQDSIAPLLNSLARLLARPAALPEPIQRAAAQVLAGRIDLGGKGPTPEVLRAVVSQIAGETSGAQSRAPGGESTRALGALKQAVSAWLGGDPAPVAPIRRVLPPLGGSIPRAERFETLPLSDNAHEALRVIHSQADAALSRMRVVQHANAPDPDPASGRPPELRVEVPFVLGGELMMAQLQVFRDGPRRRAEGKRGWIMRFAMNFSGTGEVGAEVGLHGRAIAVGLWAAEPEMATRLNEGLPHLRQALTELGLDPGALHVRNLPRPMASSPPGQRLDQVS